MFVTSLLYRDPVSLFSGFASHPHAVLLDSAVLEGDDRFSVIALHPSTVVSATSDRTYVNGREDIRDPFTVLSNILAARKTTESYNLPVSFCGGAIGYFGYELAHALEHLPPIKNSAPMLPLMVAGVYDTVAIFDNRDRRGWIVSHGQDAERKADDFKNQLLNATDRLSPVDWGDTADWVAEQTQREVEQKVQTIIDYIHAGDLFQANFTQRFKAVRPIGLSDFDIYRRLRALSPSHLSVFMRCGAMSLASASPERFLRLARDRSIETYPIKGTRPRDKNPALDALNKYELALSPKDHAENLMIVDLMRNDLSRVAELGSVTVPLLCVPRSFASVHHLVSEVRATLREGLGPLDLLQATFPGGSVTGAPKIRAMEIISELEPSDRGAYCGCLGWIGFDGAMDMSMIIRTLTITEHQVMAQAGGGIVADSLPAEEFAESMVKIKPLLQALSGKEKNETDLVKRRAAR